MPKRKASVAEVPSENEDVLDGGNNSDTPLNKAAAKDKKTKKPRQSRDTASEDDEDAKPAKKTTKAKLASPKTAKKPQHLATDPENNDEDVRVNADGEKYVDLGKKKRAQVSTFKGNTFVSIREFYGSEGEEKPGKKGITLNLEQWGILKRNSSVIDALLKGAKD